jgi:hypothetical protein
MDELLEDAVRADDREGGVPRPATARAASTTRRSTTGRRVHRTMERFAERRVLTRSWEVMISDARSMS